MNRREALIAILTMPATSSSLLVKEKQDQNGGKIQVFSSQTQLHLPLADADADEAGVTSLMVNYKGKQIKITAQEIWDALKGKPSGGVLS